MPKYLLDANVFIQAHKVFYSPNLVPGFWKWIDDAHSRSIVFSIKAIRDELLALEDSLAQWASHRKSMFLDTDDVKTYDSQKLLATWVAEKYNEASQAEFFMAADFKLVAFAHAYGYTVITQEVYAQGFKVKIPNACKEMNVPYMNQFQMLQAEGARL